MKVVAVFTSLAAVAAATQAATNAADNANIASLANSLNDADAAKIIAASKNAKSECEDCVLYCGDPSNGIALKAACIVVKCGVQCLVA